MALVHELFDTLSYNAKKNIKDFDQPGKTSFNNYSLLVNVFCDCTTVAFISGPG